MYELIHGRLGVSQEVEEILGVLWVEVGAYLRVTFGVVFTQEVGDVLPGGVLTEQRHKAAVEALEFLVLLQHEAVHDVGGACVGSEAGGGGITPDVVTVGGGDTHQHVPHLDTHT